MTVSQIVMSVVVLFYIFLIVMMILSYTKYTVDKIETRKNREAELRKIELYTLIDPFKLDDLLQRWVHTYIERYILNNFRIHNVEFINQDSVKLMMKEVSTQIVLEMSDMYLTLLKLKYNLNKDEDLIKYVYNLVADDTILSVSDYNRSE